MWQEQRHKEKAEQEKGWCKDLGGGGGDGQGAVLIGWPEQDGRLHRKGESWTKTWLLMGVGESRVWVFGEECPGQREQLQQRFYHHIPNCANLSERTSL